MVSSFKFHFSSLSEDEKNSIRNKVLLDLDEPVGQVRMFS